MDVIALYYDFYIDFDDRLRFRNQDRILDITPVGVTGNHVHHGLVFLVKARLASIKPACQLSTRRSG